MKAYLTIMTALIIAATTSFAVPTGDRTSMLEVQRGNVPGSFVVSKFGRNSAIGTTLTPVCDGGFYRTPLPANAVVLEAVSADPDDTSAGTGARALTIEYLDATGAMQTATMTMAGTSASTTVSGVWRLYRAYVSAGGSYATQSIPSQQGTITIRVAGGGQTWAVIPMLDASIGAGQSLIGAYTVPLGYTAYVFNKRAFIDSTKTADLFFFRRENAMDATAPFSGTLRINNAYIGLADGITVENSAWNKFPELTDIGYMAKVNGGTADVSVEFDILLVKN